MPDNTRSLDRREDRYVQAGIYVIYLFTLTHLEAEPEVSRWRSVEGEFRSPCPEWSFGSLLVEFCFRNSTSKSVRVNALRVSSRQPFSSCIITAVCRIMVL